MKSYLLLGLALLNISAYASDEENKYEIPNPKHQQVIESIKESKELSKQKLKLKKYRENLELFGDDSPIMTPGKAKNPFLWELEDIQRIMKTIMTIEYPLTCQLSYKDCLVSFFTHRLPKNFPEGAQLDSMDRRLSNDSIKEFVGMISFPGKEEPYSFEVQVILCSIENRSLKKQNKVKTQSELVRKIVTTQHPSWTPKILTQRVKELERQLQEWKQQEEANEENNQEDTPLTLEQKIALLEEKIQKEPQYYEWSDTNSKERFTENTQILEGAYGKNRKDKESKRKISKITRSNSTEKMKKAVGRKTFGIENNKEFKRVVTTVTKTSKKVEKIQKKESKKDRRKNHVIDETNNQPQGNIQTTSIISQVVEQEDTPLTLKQKIALLEEKFQEEPQKETQGNIQTTSIISQVVGQDKLKKNKSTKN